ncbi:hypothetical protein POM88_009744 [Heracleum sosnowskyi]|uniref:Post-SET domain-containing protein n=1 Tax=Heracleum sosnowskyi TaxID=360622 RepID=A0AAD8JC24_9APIA|nr:hypothetical protein POM88_009744 [Heracleum sosnowskyi]
MLCYRTKEVKVKTELCGWGVEAAESISKGDFIIEYVGEGNTARFLNHSCDPNCNLEKRFDQFGAEIECQCGTSSCRGYLGAKRKKAKVEAYFRDIQKYKLASH